MDSQCGLKFKLVYVAHSLASFGLNRNSIRVPLSVDCRLAPSRLEGGAPITIFPCHDHETPRDIGPCLVGPPLQPPLVPKTTCMW